ncbi:hypothetical protein SSS_02721 [Sarcoptes scabiei]|uniref:Uncharacterized protein n=1 Tax=Sarcoptes scabiei TaxID=52283 RepID=A0A834RFF8_SARSC|nr:hypothetical protein SSS_02721 [Sarcoptes scabiei]
MMSARKPAEDCSLSRKEKINKINRCTLTSESGDCRRQSTMFIPESTSDTYATLSDIDCHRWIAKILTYSFLYPTFILPIKRHIQLDSETSANKSRSDRFNFSFLNCSNILNLKPSDRADSIKLEKIPNLSLSSANKNGSKNPLLSVSILVASKDVNKNVSDGIHTNFDLDDNSTKNRQNSDLNLDRSTNNFRTKSYQILEFCNADRCLTNAESSWNSFRNQKFLVLDSDATNSTNNPIEKTIKLDSTGSDLRFESDERFYESINDSKPIDDEWDDDRMMSEPFDSLTSSSESFSREVFRSSRSYPSDWEADSNNVVSNDANENEWKAPETSVKKSDNHCIPH